VNPADPQPVVAFCVTCGNRLEHLKQTLPINLWKNPTAKIVLLDYGSTDGLGHYIWDHHRSDIALGRLVYYRFDAPHFRMAHAKNMAHRLGIREGADILVNLDCDNWAGPDFATYVTERFARAAEDNDAIYMRPRHNNTGPGLNVRNRTPFGAAGRIVVTKLAFLQAGGYDEFYSGWSPDDRDFAHRLERLGYTRSGISKRYLHLLDHGDEERFGNFGPGEPTNLAESVNRFVPDKSRDHLTIANNGRFGMGTVRRNFHADPIVLGPVPTRIFGVGMNKTATTSLAVALRKLGYDGAHWESPGWARKIYEELTANAGRSRTLEGYYCIGDMPIDFMFREIDAAYPGSKFILTERREDIWLPSIERYFARNAADWASDVFTDEVHRLIYGRADFDAETFLARYRRHNAEVREHFKDRPGDLLVMDMTSGAGWDDLCGFLGCPVPTTPYPAAFVTEEPPAPVAAYPKPVWAPSRYEVLKGEFRRRWVATAPAGRRNWSDRLPTSGVDGS
jgi:hypothetical protein